MKILPVGAELFHVEGRTDRHDETTRSGYPLFGTYTTRLLYCGYYCETFSFLTALLKFLLSIVVIVRA
jgi:hypothetical protein